MPSTATITAFYSFTANTKARAALVNTNFSNFRGHIVAIDPNTQTASNETYDLGSTEYRWRTGYFRDIDIKANTSTGQALSIIGDTAAGQGAFLFKHAGNTRARVGGGNQYIDVDTTTSQFDFKVAGITISSFKNNGMQRNSVVRSTLYSASVSSGSFTITSTLLATLSITSNGHTAKLGFNISHPTTSAENPRFLNQTVITHTVSFSIYRDGTAASNLIHFDKIYFSGKSTTTAGTLITSTYLSFYDNSVTSGGHTYYLYANTSDTGAILQSTADACKFQCIELI